MFQYWFHKNVNQVSQPPGVKAIFLSVPRLEVVFLFLGSVIMAILMSSMSSKQVPLSTSLDVQKGEKIEIINHTKPGRVLVRRLIQHGHVLLGQELPDGHGIVSRCVWTSFSQRLAAANLIPPFTVMQLNEYAGLLSALVNLIHNC